MKLNKNSKLAKLYRWYYNIYYDDYMPTSLCTYTWNIFFMFLLIIPYLILIIPSAIFKKDEYDEEYRIIYGIGFYCIIALILSMLVSPYILYTATPRGDLGFYVLPLSLGLSGYVFSIAMLLKFIFDKILSVGKSLSKKFSKVINSICPNIFWD